MEQNVRSECPRCSRPLRDFNGHIGYCTQHKWVSPAGLGYEAEAAEQNRKDAAAEEQSRLEKERREQEAKAQEVRERHQSTVRKAAAVAAALVLIAAAAVFFIVRPGLNYQHAADRFAAGDYQAAREAYDALGGYRDSAARVLLCDAMIDLQEGRPEDAAAKLDQLTGEGQKEAAKQLADALLPMIANWKERGLTPQALLLLLSKAETIDPEHTLDLEKLKEEGHTALLDGTQLSSFTEDVDSDGEPELIVLNADYTVTVYRMTADSNVRMPVDQETAAACATAFGNGYKDTDADAAVACFKEAYRLLPNEETRSALADAYQQRSRNHENAGETEAAIADARSALETAGTAEAFSFFYELNLRSCKNGHDTATAIRMWEAFAADAEKELTRFGATARWQADAAQLHLAYAAELAANRDESCIAELRTAAGMGADVTAAVAEAESHFEPGLPLVRLRLMEIELCGGDAEREQQIRSGLAEEVRRAVSEWKNLGIAPADVPVLIRLADELDIDLSGIARKEIYEEAAAAAAGNTAQHTFADWDGDGYEELLTLDAAGNRSLYGVGEKWEKVSAVDTRLPGASYTIPDESTPVILVLSSGRDELLAVTSADRRLTALFREAGICRYQAEGTTVTFSRLLEGSIARYEDYRYEAAGTASRPERTGTDWQENDYPLPADATAAVQRYFEARAYDLPGEAALLTAEPSDPGIFTRDRLNALPVPDVPGRVNAAAYETEDGIEKFEVEYTSGPQTFRTWISAEYSSGWKVTGAADTYGEGLNAGDPDYTVPLISLNAETTNTISEKKGRNTYRVLVPSAGRTGLEWQSGSSAVSRTSYTVAMYRGSLTGETVFSFALQPSPNRQKSKDLFVSAGVYYVMVEAETADAEAYHLTIPFRAEPYVELENNDTPANATAVELNTGYSGALSGAKDVDYYAFTLDGTSAVNITLGTSGNGGRAPAYTLTVFSGTDGSKLCEISVPGNAQLSETGNLYLSAGPYLVQVAKGSTAADDPYLLTVSAGQNGSMESEPNSTPETANVIPVNEDIHASTGHEGDTDCFRFTLEGDAVVQPRFTFTPTDSSSRTYVLSILDSGRREMLKVNIGGKESSKIISPAALTAGTYTVRIENPRFVRQDYTLRLVSMAVDCAEKEPNDSAALATSLAAGRPCTGVLTTETDYDYYRVVFSEQKIVTLRFSFAQSTSRNNVFTVSVEQNGKTAATWNVKGDSGGFEETVSFQPGEYYFRVKPSNWLDAVYTITIEE